MHSGSQLRSFNGIAEHWPGGELLTSLGALGPLTICDAPHFKAVRLESIRAVAALHRLAVVADVDLVEHHASLPDTIVDTLCSFLC